MAETNNKKKSNASKKNTGAASATKKQTNFNKKSGTSKAAQTKKQQAEAAARSAARRQVVSSVMFAVAILLLCITIVPSGVAEGETNLWQGLKDIFFGLFGVCAFAIPVMLFYSAYVLSKDRPLNGIALRIGGIASAAVCLSSVLHAASHSSDYLAHTAFSEQITSAWQEGLSITNGGAAGAIFGGIITRLFGKVGGLITVIILLFVLVMLLTGTTIPKLMELVVKPFSKATDYTQQRMEQKRLEEETKPVKVKEEKRPASKKTDDYQLPEPEKVLKRPKLGRGFFHDDYDPLPNKKDEPIEYVEQNDDEFKPDIPVFSPMPSGINLDIVPDEKAETKEEPVAEIPAEEPQIIAEPDVAEEAQEQLPAQDVVDLIDKAAREAQEEPPAQETIEEEPEEHKHVYVLPAVECLAEAQSSGDADIKDELTANANKLVETLRNFNIETKIVDIARGPSVTRYELQPAPGIKISRIANLADDIAMNLASSGVRIEAPIPNKAAVGIEVPNRTRLTVTMREIVESPQFRSAKSKLNVALGKDISGNVICTDLAKMPHLLVAGTTGSGKSVCLNAMIISILFNSTPDEVKLIMIDPKQVEFTVYRGIPHLMVPVVSDARKAAGALSWAVSEMLKRYKLFSEKGVRDIGGYNKLAAKTPDMQPMYQICIFIDELSDLMMVAKNEVEDSVCRLAQMARAAGMHLVIATQRPSVDVITGLIKANIPSRLALYVSQQVDSRTIIDTAGAEKLLGNGDMLFSPVGISKPLRIQGCYVSDEEVEKVTDFIRAQGECEYDSEVMEEIEKAAVMEKKKGSDLPDPDSSPDSQADEETMRAIAVVVENQLASTTLLQRKLKIGYAKAARIMDELEEKGIIGPFEGAKPRKVLMSKQQFNEMIARGDSSPLGIEGSEE
ncbi:MAG: DNA translocase FtsK [Clostridia bacterium]|nr:DNA translocase FtsK [Clostridia bacterium]